MLEKFHTPVAAPVPPPPPVGVLRGGDGVLRGGDGVGSGGDDDSLYLLHSLNLKKFNC